MHWDKKVVAQHCIGMHQMSKCMEITLPAGEMQKYVEKKTSVTLTVQNHCGKMFQPKTLESASGIQLPKHIWSVHTSPCSLSKSSAKQAEPRPVQLPATLLLSIRN